MKPKTKILEQRQETLEQRQETVEEELPLEAQFLRQCFMNKILDLHPEEILQVASELYTRLLLASQMIRKLRDPGKLQDLD